MLIPSRRSGRTAGFTLIELLTVIAIIGILAAIVIPTVGSVTDKAKRAVDQTNIREIAKAATIFAQDNNDALPDPSPTSIPATVLNATQRAFLWPGIMARNNILTDPKIYFSKLDPAFSGTYPLSIIAQTDTTKRTLDTTFTSGRSLSYEFVGGLRTSDPATTPVVFTRGLQANGTWNINSGVYKDTGGYIAFLGGNVEWFTNTQTPTPAFTSNNSGRRVGSILQGIPFAPRQARIYGIPPTSGAILGNPGTGTAAQRGP
ncbi:MAG: prepilin-type N-terminal cleavage/methylation domain-containing protein [Opitutaceae bacterium]|nr:prepilin-type N-terminal cleavage/methylation domain-containing protein [Opitutaceae bacterium]